MDLTAFYSQFRDETAENIRVLNQGLLSLERGLLSDEERRDQIAAIFRAMHTIKGSARLLGFENVGRVAHTCESMLGDVREGQRGLDSRLADLLLRAGDAIQELIAAQLEGRAPTVDPAAVVASLTAGPEPAAPTPEPAPAAGAPVAPVAAPEPAPATPAPAPAPPEPPADGAARPAARQTRGGQATVRVRVDRLDRLLNLAGELAVAIQFNSAHRQTLEELRALLVQQQRALLALDADIQRLRFSKTQRDQLAFQINGALNAAEQASRLIKTQADRFSEHDSQTAQIVEDLEQEVMSARLLPVSSLFANFPRAVRELARDAGKEIELLLVGEQTELDRKVIEALADPLIHMIRNAVDHGIEPADERERAGKPRAGTLRVQAQAFGAYAQIAISDDGRGMDPARLRQSAIRKGLIGADVAARLTDQEALDLIFMPGFSTAQMITDISGRGVGMDVVRTNINELGGQVLLESRVGHGTTITLVLPLTLVTTRVLLVNSGSHTFALPASGCLGTMWTLPSQIKTMEGHTIINYESHLAPLVRLEDLLGLTNGEEAPPRRRMPTLIVGTNQRPLAVMVDRLIDEREVVVKPLGPLLERQRQYSGAIQLGDGELVLLLNPLMLTQLARGLVTVAPARSVGPQRHARLLVADDSFTTRELIRSILQSAGYDVATAVDGLDALDKLRGESYDLVVSDVEMPRVDGFQLTDRIRRELGKTDLPVIIVTSLASEAHRRRGLEVGAQAYIVKSQFDQSNLLETIRQLLGA